MDKKHTKNQVWIFIIVASAVLSSAALLIVLFGTSSNPLGNGGSHQDDPCNTVCNDRLQKVEQQLSQALDRLEQLDGINAADEHTRKTLAQTQNTGELVKHLDENGQLAQLEQAVAARLESKLTAGDADGSSSPKRQRNEQGEWEAPIDELSDVLDLTSEQQEAATKIFTQVQDDFLTVMQTKQDDGGSLVDDFAMDLKSGTSVEEAKKKFVQRMLEENIPGSERSFLSEIVALRNDVMSDLAEELDSNQMDTLKGLRIDPLNVKTGTDTIGKYIEQKIAE